jgi:hypothetical protein
MGTRWVLTLAMLGVTAGGGCGDLGPSGNETPEREPVSPVARALAEPTVTLTIDLGGYLGSINIGAFTAAGQGTAYVVDLPSGQHDITTPFAFAEDGQSTRLATLTVDAVAGTISLSSPHFQPVAPGDRVLHLKTLVFPYDPDGSASFPVGLLAIGGLTGGGGVSSVHVLDNRRYQIFQASSWTRDGSTSTFSALPDIFVRNGCVELVPGALVERSFSVHNCRLHPRLTVIIVGPHTDVPVALLGVQTLPPGQPFKVIRERLYRFTGPSSFDLVTGGSEFSEGPDLFVGSEGGPDVAYFLPGSKASRLFSTQNRMINAVATSRVTFDGEGSTTDLVIADGYPIDDTSFVRGRRYLVKAVRSWDPDDLVSQNFIAGRFGDEPGLTIGDDGKLTVTDAVLRHFRVSYYPPRLTAKVGNVRLSTSGFKEKIRINARILPNGAGHCGTKVLTGRLHQIALIAPGGIDVASSNFIFGFDGRCTPSTITFPQGTVTLDCSL